MNRLDSRWLRTLGGEFDTAGAVICYPHAGAGASAYAGWPRRIAPGYTMLAVQPPGRHDRSAEVSHTSVQDAAGELAAEVAALRLNSVVLLGHSFGALVMYETAQALRRIGAPAPDLLVVSGQQPPISTGAVAVRRDWTDQELLDLCRDLGAVQVAELARDLDIRPLILDPLRADLAAIEQYRHQPEDSLAVAIRVLTGEQDPATTPDSWLGWAALTERETLGRSYPGGHFFIESARSAVVADLARDLAGLAEPGCAVSGADAGGPAGQLSVSELAGIFGEVLGQHGYPADASLFRLGGTSLDAVRIAQRLERRLERPVRVAQVIAHPSPARLAAGLAGSAGGPQHPERGVPAAVQSRSEQPGSGIEGAGSTLSWPLPSPQRRIWLLHERVPDRRDHTVTVSLQLDGEVPVEALSRSWSRLLDSYPTLRMRVDDSDGLYGRAAGAVGQLQQLDVTALPAALATGLVDEAVERLRREPFDLRTGPLARALLVRRPGEPACLELAISHLTCDGWSLQRLIDELFQAALGEPFDEPAGCDASYAEFAAWEQQASERWPDQLETAAARLLPVPARLELPSTGMDPTAPATEVSLAKDAGWAEALRSAAAAQSSSPLAVALTALAVVLNRVSGQEQFYVAIPLANRPEPRFERTVGDFVNASIARFDLVAAETVRQLAEMAREQVLAIYDTQSLPLELLLRRLRADAADAADAVTPRVALTMQNLPRHHTSYADGSVAVRWVEVAERESKYDIVVTMDTERLDEAISITASPAVLSTETATALLARLDRALDRVLDELGPGAA